MSPMPRVRELPINCAARNAVWVFPRVARPRFPGAPEVVETARSHQVPDFSSLPEGSDVTVELYGGACSLWINGENHRVYDWIFLAVSALQVAVGGWLARTREVPRQRDSDPAGAE